MIHIHTYIYTYVHTRKIEIAKVREQTSKTKNNGES